MKYAPGMDGFLRCFAPVLVGLTISTTLLVTEGEAGECPDDNQNVVVFADGLEEKMPLKSLVLRNCPSQWGAKVRLGQTYEIEGDLDKAEDIYNGVVSKVTERMGMDQIVAMGGLASIMEKRNRLKDAREVYESLLEKIHSEQFKGVEGVDNLERYFTIRMEDIQSTIRKNAVDKEMVPLIQADGQPPVKVTGIEFTQEVEHKSKAAYSESVQGKEKERRVDWRSRQ